MIRKNTYIWLVGVAVSMVLLIACNSNDGDGSFNAGGGAPVIPVGGLSLVLSGVLSGDQEVLPVVTGGSGASSITVSANGSTIDYIIDIDGPLSSDITQAHIHTGAVSANGPIMFWLCTDLGNAPATIPAPPACTQPTVTLSGSFTSADFDVNSGLASFDDAVAEITSLNSYINVHTVTNIGGELRGQIGTTP